jgi:hypothetical protein
MSGWMPIDRSSHGVLRQFCLELAGTGDIGQRQVNVDGMIARQFVLKRRIASEERQAFDIADGAPISTSTKSYSSLPERTIP